MNTKLILFEKAALEKLDREIENTLDEFNRLRGKPDNCPIEFGYSIKWYNNFKETDMYIRYLRKEGNKPLGKNLYFNYFFYPCDISPGSIFGLIKSGKIRLEQVLHKITDYNLRISILNFLNKEINRLVRT